MTSSDNDIIVDEMGEIETNSFSPRDEFSERDAATPLRELEDEGISILEDDSFPQGHDSHEQISRDLFEEEGIEIISGDEE